jgi:hypothetical protein
MEKQTAVEWIEDKIQSDMTFIEILGLIRQAKEMEKEQMDKVSADWWVEGASYIQYGKRKYETFEQYYNETFGK